MAFADQKSLKERSAGMAGAIILPAALGAIFISGLAVKDIILPPKQKPIKGITVKLPPHQRQRKSSNPNRSKTQLPLNWWRRNARLKSRLRTGQ